MKTTLRFLLFLLFFATQNVQAADGFDNNLISNDAFEMIIAIYNSTTEHRVTFGPSALSSGGYYIAIPNNAEHNAGVVNYFKIKKIFAHPRSAYFDRVDGVTFYYRIYTVGSSPPGYSTLDDYPFDNAGLNENECYTTSQQDDWIMDRASDHFDVLNGLGNGTYIFQFYIVCDLHDVGDESNPCSINATLLCDQNITHPGRKLDSRFPNGMVDPNVCFGSPNYYDSSNYPNWLVTPGKIRFQVTTAAPLTWLQFQAQKVREGIALQWATQQERDVDYFDLQRSGDGLRWESIYEQVAVGYSEKRSDYQFTDVLPLPGLDYYRLRSVDFDGSEDFSPTVAVRYGSDPAQAVMYPSPASSSVSFQLEADAREKAAFAFLFDPLGRLARSVRLPEPGGPDTPIPLDDLVAGLYFVEFRSEEGVRLATGKFLKRGN